MSYDDCKVSKLKFKTNSAVTKKKRKKKESREKVVVKDPDSDSEEYDGWWKVCISGVYLKYVAIRLSESRKQ